MSGRPRVAIVHSFYSSRQPSGENRVVQRQVEALRGAGCEVRLVAESTDDRERHPLYPLQAAATVATGYGRTPLQELHEFEPDVVHVHNLFPNYGRRWVSRWNGPIVATLHNYRPLCAAGTFYRNGRVCTDCLDHESAWPAFKNGSYRGSRLRTLPLALSMRLGADPLLRRANRIIVLHSAMRALYERAGVPAGKMTVLSNFATAAQARGRGGGSWLFVGRLSPEKGVLELVREWPAGRRLLIAGDGELRAEIAAAAPSGVELLGDQPPETVQRLMRDAVGLVFPSRWFEGFPMVYVESLAAGTPVLAWEPASVARLVDEERTGLVVDDLTTAVERAEAEFPAMRDHCRSVFDSRYTQDSWVEGVLSIYRDVR